MNAPTNKRLYLFDRLDTGQQLHIVFMSHNAYWANAEMLSECYGNCKVQVFGKGTSYLEMAKYSKWYEPIDDCDLIVLRETNFNKYEFAKMKKLAHEISKEKNKTITIGYAYLNHNHEEIDFNKAGIVKLAKINNEEEVESSTTIIYMHAYDIINAALIMHDNKEKKLVKEKTNK